MEIEQVRHAHFIGIGGIGVSAVARLLLLRGCVVSGSDARSSEVTAELERLGAAISIGHAAENIPPQTELVVYSPAIPADNPERAEAIKRGIPQKSYPEVLGELMVDTYGVAVSGTNGKTTTTALLGHILVEAGLDPTVIVGSKVNNFNGSNLRVGDGSYSVVEGCEYRRHFLNLRPQMIVLTNVEVDHLDYFKDFDDVKAAFREYVALLPPEGILVYNGDDPASREVAASSRGTRVKKIVYHPEHSNIPVYYSGGSALRQTQGKLTTSVRLLERRPAEGGQVLRMALGESELTTTLSLPGQIYAVNALAAVAAAHALGVAPEKIAQAVASFRGTWRRFERVGEADGFDRLTTSGSARLTTSGKPIISDYAHHPTAVRETLKAAREFFPGKRILAVFQPHQRDRTKNLLNEFAHSFDESDGIIVAEIYDVAGREEGLRISSRDLVSRLEQRGRPARYAASPDEALAMTRDLLPSFGAVLIMGAGDIYTIAPQLCD